MRRLHRTGLGTGGLVALLSVVVLAGLAVLLWKPWDKPRFEGKLRFYCAAGMTRPVTAIMEQYQSEFPKVSIEPSFGGSGEMISVMKKVRGEGDLYLSADSFHMEKAKEAGLIAETIPVARIHPVLVVQTSSQQEWKKQRKDIQRLKDLLRKDLIVVLGAETTAVGRASREAFVDAGLWQQIQNRPAGKRVTGTTVNDVALKVRETENAVGIIWDITAVMHKEKLTVVDVPELKAISEQVLIGVLAKSKQPTQALRFARYLTAKDKGMASFKEHSYDVMPDADLWSPRPRIVLAAGAMLKPGIEEAVDRFKKREGIEIDTAYAGCGILVSDMKILNKGTEETGRKLDAFPDAYFSCDLSFMEGVKQWFDSSVMVSKNDMVLVVQKENPEQIRSLDDLKRKELKVGLGDPERSALGKLTDMLLVRLKYHGEVYADDREYPIVHKSEGHDLVNNVRLKALDAAVVYRSNVKSTPRYQDFMEIVEIKLGDSFARQPFAVAKKSEHKYLMQRLLQTILEEQTLSGMKELGFEIIHEQ